MVSVTVVAALAGWPVILTVWPAGRRWWAWSKWAVSASQEQTLSRTGARVGWLSVVTGISAASTGGFLVSYYKPMVSNAENCFDLLPRQRHKASFIVIEFNCHNSAVCISTTSNYGKNM